MNIVEFRLRCDEEYSVSALSHHRRQVWWRGPGNRGFWICAGILAVLAAISLAAHLFVPAVVLGGLTGMVVGATLIGDPIDIWFLKRRLRASPFHNNSLVFLLFDAEIHVRGKNEEARLKWSAFSKARRFGDGLLLYQGPQFFNWLPDTAASSPEAISAAQELAKAKIADYRDV